MIPDDIIVAIVIVFMLVTVWAITLSWRVDDLEKKMDELWRER